MATDNRTLVQKADLVLAEIAAGGLFQTGQADSFIRLAINKPVMLQDVHVFPMTRPVEERDKSRFAGRVLRAGTEAAGLPFAQRVTPALSLVTMTARLYRTEVRITDEVLEDQIERGSFKNTVMEQLAEAVGRDIEFVAINGDVASADPLLALQNGWITLAVANQVAGGGAQLSQTLLRDTMLALPDEFTDIPSLRFYTNYHAQIRYQDQLAQRATGLGDAALNGSVGTAGPQTSGGEPGYNRVPVRAVPEFPSALGAGGNETVSLLTSPKNLALGMLRKFNLETQRDAPAGVTIIVGSLRFAVNIYEVNAVARLNAVIGR